MRISTYAPSTNPACSRHWEWRCVDFGPSTQPPPKDLPQESHGRLSHACAGRVLQTHQCRTQDEKRTTSRLSGVSKLTCVLQVYTPLIIIEMLVPQLSKTKDLRSGQINAAAFAVMRICQFKLRNPLASSSALQARSCAIGASCIHRLLLVTRSAICFPKAIGYVLS